MYHKRGRKEFAHLPVCFLSNLQPGNIKCPCGLVVQSYWIGAITARILLHFNHFSLPDTRFWGYKLTTIHSVNLALSTLHDCTPHDISNNNPLFECRVIVALQCYVCNVGGLCADVLFPDIPLTGFPCSLQNKAHQDCTRPYASPSIWGSLCEWFSLACCSLIFAIVPCTSFEMPARSTDSSCEMTGLLPLAVSQ